MLASLERLCHEVIGRGGSADELDNNIYFRISNDGEYIAADVVTRGIAIRSVTTRPDVREFYGDIRTELLAPPHAVQTT